MNRRGGAPLACAGVQSQLPSRVSPPLLFAHRGSTTKSIENITDSLLSALRSGASGLACAASLTTTGEVLLGDAGQAAGRGIRRSIMSTRRAQVPPQVLSLAEVYEVCGTDFDLSLDSTDGATGPEVIAAAREAGAEDRLWLHHQDVEVLSSWRELSGQVHLVHATQLRRLDQGPERHTAQLSSARIDALELHHSEWSGGLTTLVHRFDLCAFTWDAQFERVVERAVLLGMDAVAGNDVDVMVGVVRRLG